MLRSAGQKCCVRCLASEVISTQQYMAHNCSVLHRMPRTLSDAQHELGMSTRSLDRAACCTHRVRQAQLLEPTTSRHLHCDAPCMLEFDT